MNFDRYFRLNERRGDGVFCGKEGLFVGDTPLLEETLGLGGRVAWQVRSPSQLATELSKSYGVSVDFGAKTSGAAAVARALTNGDLTLARIAALLLQLPDPPLSKAGEAPHDRSNELVGRLQRSRLLKADWDPEKHPRWPAGSADGAGGQFAPADGDGAAGEARASIIPAQISIPFDVPETIPFPLPSEIVPPLATPALPRSLPQNPYPSRPECVKEWQDAFEFCWGLKTKGQLGRGAYRGMGRTMRDCMLGQVSESCGGNAAST
jgi:hypothetical protein